MTTNDMNAEVLVLDQTRFALDAEAFATFQRLVDNPPLATASLRRPRSQARRPGMQRP